MGASRTTEATFCFIDIAGYTALTEAHGELAAADLVEEFDRIAREAVEPYGKIQEFLGDCAFLVFAGPGEAIHALSSVYKKIANRPHFPVVRGGLNHGPALLRGNRYFGSTVNVAARVAAEAKGGEILGTESVAEILRAARIPGLEVERRGLMRLKNLPQAVQLYEIVLPGVAHEYAIDPVCKMQVDKRHAAGELRYGERTYWFCSLVCIERFAKQPSAYLQA